MTKAKDYSQHIIPLEFEQPAIPVTKTTLCMDENKLYSLEFNHSQDTIEHLLLSTKENIHATLLLTIKSQEFHKQTIDLKLEKNSSLTLIILQGNGDTFVGVQNINLNKNSKLVLMHTDLGSKKSILKQRTILGDKSELRNLSFAVKQMDQQLDYNSQSIHEGKKSVSNLDSIMVLDHKADVRSRMLVQINKDAFDSQGYETEDTLVLSKDCRVKSVPDLLIHNDKVSCSHSASIHKLNREALFYLMSRGLSKDSAITLMRDSFIRAQIRKLNDEKLEQVLFDFVGVKDE